MFYIYILDILFESGKIHFEEGETILNLLEEQYPKFVGKNCELMFLRKLGTSSCCLVSKPNELYFEKGMKIIESLNLPELMEELKIKL